MTGTFVRNTRPGRVTRTKRAADCSDSNWTSASSSSTIDLTIASAAAAARVSGWEVLFNFESLSDHAYVAFSFGAPRSSEGGHVRRASHRPSPVEPEIVRRRTARRVSRRGGLERQSCSRRNKKGARYGVGSPRSVGDWDYLQRISDSCTQRVGSRAKTQKRPKYW